MIQKVLRTTLATVVSLSMVMPGVVIFADDAPPTGAIEGLSVNAGADGTANIVKKSGLITADIKGLEKGGMVAASKTKPEPKKPRKKAGGGGKPRGKGQPNAPQTRGVLY